VRDSSYVYTDAFTVSFLVYHLPGLIRRRLKKVFYQDRTNTAYRIYSFLLKAGVVHASVEPLAFHLWELTDEQGRSPFPDVLEKTNKICAGLRERVISEMVGTPLFFSKNELALFLDRAIWENVYKQVVYVLAIERHKKSSGILVPATCQFRYQYIFKGDIFFRSLASESLKYSIYFDLNVFSIFLPFSQRIKHFFRGLVSRNSLGMGLGPSLQGSPSPKKEVKLEFPAKTNKTYTSQFSGGGRIAALYMGKSISFNLDERSDFFWLLNSELPKNKLSVVFWRDDIPITDTDLDLLDKNGASYWFIGKVSPNSRIPCWGPARIPKRDLLVLIGWLGLSLLRRPFSALTHYLPETARLFYGFLLWREFIDNQGIRLSYVPNDCDKYNMAIHSAVRTSGGVGVSNQFSNIWFSSRLLSTNADVQFLFSPHYERFWKQNGSIISSVVYTGYVTDHSFLATKGKSANLRSQLLNRGAKTIVAFFDENSSDDPYSIIGNQRAADLYSYLLRWMIDDKEIGLIFKPGYPKTLYSRIPGCVPLFNQALETGRCVLAAEGKYVTDRYPAEVAQAADLAVGLYVAGTAVLESLLAGTPTVFLDLEKLYSGDLYPWGRGEVIFDSLDGLRSYVDNGRKVGGPFQLHPRLAQWAQERDSFRDGQASRRMGQYLDVLHKELGQGHSNSMAVEKANQAHRARWGEESVSVWK
jgi:hypothetical protein